MLGAFILAGLLAPDTDNNVTYQALPLLLFLLVAAVCWSWSFKARFAATRLLPRFGTRWLSAPLPHRGEESFHESLQRPDVAGKPG